MTAQILDGKALSKKIRTEIAREIQNLGSKPGLAVILVGNDHASTIYVKNKRHACDEVGIQSFYYALSPDINESGLISLIHQLNVDPAVNGILLQLPLPSFIDSDKVLESIHPEKDVDGFHPYNLGRLAQRRPLLRPCTPYGVMMLLDSIQETYKNRQAVVIGASNIVGRPMALELLLAGCTVTICHKFTKNLEPFVREADIVISAVGKKHLIKGDWIKPNATVIDIGITRSEDGSLSGDVEFEKAKEKAAWITPVPGGVGPMTVAALMKNTLTAFKKSS